MLKHCTSILNVAFPHLVSTIKTMVDKMIADAGWGKGMPTPEISDFG